MTTTMTSRLHCVLALAAMLGLSILVPLHAYSQQGSAPAAKAPDFTGVWRPINPPDAPRVGTTLRWLPRPGELPSFTPEYEARYKKVQASRETGSEETEPGTRCLPPGMPYFIFAEYGLEIVQAHNKLAFFSEWMDAYRRVHLDGRKTASEPRASSNGASAGARRGAARLVGT